MSSADEVALVNTLDRADLTALSAVNTFFVIDRCKVILYNYSSRGAGLFAFAAGNTAVFAVKPYPCAFIMVVAGNNDTSRVTNKMDYTVGTFLDA